MVAALHNFSAFPVMFSYHLTKQEMFRIGLRTLIRAQVKSKRNIGKDTQLTNA